MEYDSYSTGEVILPPGHESPSLRTGGLSEPEAGAEPGPAAKR